MDLNSSITTDIDNKKNNGDSEEFLKNVKNFSITAVAFFVGFIIVLYPLNVGILYATKVVQSGITPCDTAYTPYTDAEKNIIPNPDTNKININILHNSDKTLSSQKITFSNDAFQDSWLGMLRKFKNKSNQIAVGDYYATILQDIMVVNYNVYQWFFTLLSNIPESILLIFGFIPLLILFALMIIINVVFMPFILPVYNFRLLMNENTNKDGKPKWEPPTERPTYFLYGCYALFMVYVTEIFGLFTSLFAFLIQIHTFFTHLCPKAKEDNRTYTYSSMFHDGMTYHSNKLLLFICIILFIFIIIYFSVYTGLIGMVFFIVGYVLLAYYTQFSIFQEKNPDNETNFTKYEPTKQGKIVTKNSDVFTRRPLIRDNSSDLKSGGGNMKQFLKKIQKIVKQR